MELVFVVLLFCILSQPTNGGWGKGSLVMIGGNLREDNFDIWTSMVQLSGGEEASRIGIITAANSDPAYWGQYYVDMFLRYNVREALWIPVTEEEGTAFNDENVDMIKNMTGIFLGGGEPWRLAAALMQENNGKRQDTPVMSAIRKLVEEGGMLAGTSAGIMALTDDVIVTGGASWEALVFGAHEDEDGTDTNMLTYDPLGGVNIIEGVLIDAHFSNKARQGRLVRLASDTEVLRALGVDEDTALICDEAKECKVIGEAGVWIVDLSSAQIDKRKSSGNWLCENAITSYITKNDKINMVSWEVQFSEDKEDVINVENDHAETSEDIFGTSTTSNELSEFNKITSALLLSMDNNTFGYTIERNPVRYKVVFEKTSMTRASRDDKRQQISYDKLVLDFYGEFDETA